MNNILFFYIGNNTLPKFESDFIENASFYHFSDNKNIFKSNENSNSTILLDFSDLGKIKSKIANLKTINQVFIITQMNEESETANQMKEILDKILLLLITLTNHLMVQKHGKVWLVYKQTQNCTGIALDLISGLGTMIHVYAMEIAKKGIAANFVKTDAYKEQLHILIDWGNQDLNFNFTAQNLSLS